MTAPEEGGPPRALLEYRANGFIAIHLYQTQLIASTRTDPPLERSSRLWHWEKVYPRAADKLYAAMLSVVATFKPHRFTGNSAELGLANLEHIPWQLGKNGFDGDWLGKGQSAGRSPTAGTAIPVFEIITRVWRGR